ncbi:stage III sporulation protein AH [Jeotgalibacillus proteolyticus]|uniref:Stage III sporulation protein AH n=2 Tax=Jeotgalibacillus proteolyticus TaxID=2082395 RepID=A0A2S5GFS2_9BACL|nr:stage III sporulation protein AH [Jeotgalibacillus proteolyticus]
MLKKQTVWLLTMVSLVVVLSVYYVTSPRDQASPILPDQTTDMVLGEDGEEWVLEDEVDVSADAVEDEMFDVLRMEMQDARNALRDQLETKVASNEFSSAEKNEAYTEMDELIKLESKEAMIETMIKGLGYEDALVRSEEDRVIISVKSADNSHSREAANELIQLGRKELGESKYVYVEFQPNE